MQDKVTGFAELYYKLNDGLKWKVSDKRILMTIASMYAMNHKTLDLDNLLRIADRIKDKAGLFSAMKSYSRFTAAAALDVKFEQPDAQINQLFQLYDLFRKAKFSSGVYTYLAASTVLTNPDSSLTYDQIIRRTKELHDGMKKEHVFLTGASDYPLAVLLAYEHQTDIIQQMETYYDELSKYGFWKGNDLQFLSHILTLDREAQTDDLVGRTVAVMDAFRASGIRPKQLYYPVIGMLALLDMQTFDMSEVTSMYHALNEKKGLKWYKDMNVIMAATLYINGKQENNSLAEASIHTTLETILQAQQAVMIATITAATTAANSSNNS